MFKNFARGMRFSRKGRTMRICLLGLIVWALVFGTLILTPPKARPDLSGKTMAVGINYPWLTYGLDVGASAWGHYGFSNPESYRKLSEDFACLSSMNIRLVRWFVFCDGRAGIIFAPDGKALGLDAFVIADFEAILKVARQQEIYLIPVLLDYGFAGPASIHQGVQAGGHARSIVNPEYRQALLKTVFEPLVRRFGHDEMIAAWDIINEPEWVMKLSRWKSSGKLPVAKVRSFVTESAALVHQHSKHPVTVGSAASKWVENWVACGLDFYQVHWYPHIEKVALPDVTGALLNLDRPLMLGEFPTSDQYADPAEFINTARLNGFNGALAWSYRAGDKYSNFARVAPPRGDLPRSCPMR